MNLSGSSYVRVAAVGGEVLEGAGLVEVARRAHALVDNGARLEAIGEYDVRVHGAHVQVVQNRRLQAIRTVAQVRQLLDLVAHLVEVCHHVERHVHLDLNRSLHCSLHVVDQQLNCRRRLTAKQNKNKKHFWPTCWDRRR